jgi:hypothetical protein
MSNKWLYNIRHVNAGEPVQAGIVNRPDAALETRTDYLKDRLDAAALGQALFDVDATVAEDVLEGQPVFWNAQTQRYEQAIVAVAPDAVTQNIVAQPSSDCVGLVYKKKTNNLADIVLHGIVKLPAITNAIAAPITPGRYYLSAAQPGKLVKARPAAPVSVCYVQGAKDNCAADPWIIVIPQMHDFLSDHVHHRFELFAQPVGTVSVVDGRYQMAVASDTDIDTATGWLPANHASFNGKAPANAAFGYNLKAHAQLAQVWPPVPVSAASVLWDKGTDLTGAFEVPIGCGGLVVLDVNGIWWMSNCVNDVPWSDSAAQASSSSSAGIECPREERMRVIVAFLRMLYANDKNIVTSLYADPAGPLQITNCNNENAITGDLKIDLNLQLLVDPGNTNGGQALKEITANNTFKRGWVTEGVFSVSEAIVLTGSNTRTLTAAEKTAFNITDPATTVHQGLVRLAFNDPSLEREIAPQIVRLSDVIERLYYDVPYLAFPQSQESSLRLRFNVPNSGLSSSLQMAVTAQLLSRAAGGSGLPLLNVTYRKLPRPTSGAVDLTKFDVTGLTLNYATAITADKVVEVSTAPFTVDPGDTVLVTISRPATNSVTAYNGEIGLLRVAGVVSVPGT